MTNSGGVQQFQPDRSAELLQRRSMLEAQLLSVDLEMENDKLKKQLEQLGNDLTSAQVEQNRLQQAVTGMENELKQFRPADVDVTQAPTIFVVHGQNEGYKEAVARLIEKIIPDSKVVILHEQPNQGRVIIDKFEHYAATASFAVVIMSGDDKGARSTEEELKFRARQNVILELGYFIAKLGRERVAVLYEETVEAPGDILGVGYTALDGGGAWRTKLAQELDAAGLSVDFKRIK